MESSIRDVEKPLNKLCVIHMGWDPRAKAELLVFPNRVGKGALILTYKVKWKQYGAEHGKGLGFLFLLQLWGIEAILDLPCFLEATTYCYRRITFYAFLSCYLDKESYVLCAN